MERLGTGFHAAFVALFALGVLSFVHIIAYRLEIMFAARAADVRWDRPMERLKMLMRYGIGQGRMTADFWAGVMHILVFAGFMTVSLRTVTLFGVGLTGDMAYHLPLLGYDSILGQLYAFVKDFISALVVVGVVWFAQRRVLQRPKQLETPWGPAILEPLLILGTIASLMLTDFLIEAAEVAHAGTFQWFRPLSSALAGLVPHNETVIGAVWGFGFYVHTALILAFSNYLPLGKHFHIITALPNTFFARLDPPGKLRTIHDIEERVEAGKTVGIADLEDLSWKQIFDTYTCTECGRCVPECPAHASGKPLEHKYVNMYIRAHAHERVGRDTGRLLVDGKATPWGYEWTKDAEGLDSLVKAKKLWNEAEKKYELHEGETLRLTGDVIKPETIWACTLCRDCEVRCPVFIEQIPRIVDMRRHLVMTDQIPHELQGLFRNMERAFNPWGLAYDKRDEWTKRADVPVPVIGELDDDARKKLDYLLYVGCMGSYDDRTVKTMLALVRILNHAGVRFAVLGKEESCNGETVRRLGNEYLAQMMMKNLAEVMNGYEVKNIITNCPHCFNTLAHEYPDFGGHYEVHHAAAVVDRLVAEGRIKLDKKANDLVVLHDSCFLGRYNDIYDAPRRLIDATASKRSETRRSGSQSFCCGAGGGRMWLEEGEPRVNNLRFDEIMEQKPDTIAVNCPFCRTMLTDASKARNLEEQVKVVDVIELVDQSIAR